MSNIIFKGLKSVLKSAYNSTPLEEKIGYIWFVRDNKTDDRGEIYLGSRFYGTSRGDALTEEYVNTLINEKVDEVKKQVESLISGNVLKFYCIEEVIVTLNDNSIKYPANTSVELFIDDGDIFDITTSSDNSIYSLSSLSKAATLGNTLMSISLTM